MKSGPSWAVALLAALSASSLPVLASPVEVLNENAAATAELATSSSEVIAGHPVEKTDRMSITVRNEANETAYAYFIGGDPAAGRPGHLNAAGSWLYMDGPNSHLEKAPGIVIQPNQTGHITLPAGGFGGRVWVSQGKPLDFYGQSQPPFADGSAGSTSYNTSFGFLEIHARDQYVWADISYIDFAAVNLGYNLTNADGEGHHNPGLPAGSIQRICDRLNAVGWGEACIKRADGSVLGVLPPGHVLSLSQFLVPYIDYVWERLRETALVSRLRLQGSRMTCRRKKMLIRAPDIYDQFWPGYLPSPRGTQRTADLCFAKQRDGTKLSKTYVDGGSGML